MNLRKLLLLLSLACATITVQAQVIYNTRTAYDLAHPGNYVIDFNNYNPGPTQYNSVTAPTPFGGVTFNAIPSNLNFEFLGNGNIPFLGPGNLALYAFNGQFLSDSLLATLPSNSFSFGVDLISPSGTVPEPYQLTVYSGGSVLATLSSPSVATAYTFIGFDSLTSPITSVAFQIANAVGASQPTIDNFTVVPEPATWLVGTLALVGTVLAARRRASAKN